MEVQQQGGLEAAKEKLIDRLVSALLPWENLPYRSGMAKKGKVKRGFKASGISGWVERG